MRSDRAFGLRDLVAVLCLSALALPLLAASIPGAVSLSAEVRCRTNLAALTRCVVAYAEQNRGFMPVYRHRVLDDRYIEAPHQPDRTAAAFGGNPNPVTGLLNDPMNFGHLYVQGFARPPELFYCPAPIRDKRHMLSYYPKPWGSKPGAGSSLIRTGYMWNPWVKILSGDGGYARATYDDALVLRRHPANWPLVCDLVMGMDYTGHRDGDSAIWNMAYPDGHVSPFADQELYDWFAIGGDLARLEWSAFNTHVRAKVLPAGP